jgi:hypothetical protein
MFTYMRMRENPQSSRARRHQAERERVRAVALKREETRAQKAQDALLAHITARQEELWREPLAEYRAETNLTKGT